MGGGERRGGPSSIAPGWEGGIGERREGAWREHRHPVAPEPPESRRLAHEGRWRLGEARLHGRRRASVDENTVVSVTRMTRPSSSIVRCRPSGSGSPQPQVRLRRRMTSPERSRSGSANRSTRSSRARRRLDSSAMSGSGERSVIARSPTRMTLPQPRALVARHADSTITQIRGRRAVRPPRTTPPWLSARVAVFTASPSAVGPHGAHRQRRRTKRDPY